MFYGQQQLCGFLLFLLIYSYLYYFLFGSFCLRDALLPQVVYLWFVLAAICNLSQTPRPRPRLRYRLREIVFSFSFLFVDFLFVFGIFLFFGIALGMFDMISGIALVNLTKNEQKKMRKLSALLLLSSVYSKDNLSASGTPYPLPLPLLSTRAMSEPDQWEINKLLANNKKMES